MATRQEMIAYLKTNHPEMCEYNNIDYLVTDSSEIKDCGVSGTNTVYSLYIQYHGGKYTWDTLTPSEKEAVYNVVIAVDLFYLDRLNDDAPVFNVEEMKNNWIYADKDGKRLGISGGGVLSINSRPFTKDGHIMCTPETIKQGLLEHFS